MTDINLSEDWTTNANVFTGQSGRNLEEPERHPCPDCGKMVTRTAAGKPRAHKCEPKVQAGPVKAQGITADLVIAKYIETRDEIAALKKKFDTEKAELEALQEKRANWLKGKLDELGLESMKTEVGTVFVDFKDTATVSDGEAFFNWIGEDYWARKAYLNKAVNKSMVKADVDEEVPIPPGVNFMRFKDVKVRRA